MQHAVHPHAHDEALFGRLDVDVGGVDVHRLGEQVVDELDDGRLFGHLPKLARHVAAEEPLHRPFLAHGFDEAVDVVVGGDVKGHRLGRVEVGEHFHQGTVA